MSIRTERINYWHVIVAALAAFVMSSLYYSPPLVGGIWRALDPAAAAITFSLWKPLIEILRTLGIAFVMAHLLVMVGAKDVASSVIFALWIWLGFSALMWVGAVMWEGTPWQVDLLQGFRTRKYLRDYPPIRREACASRDSRTSRLWRSCARRIGMG